MNQQIKRSIPLVVTLTSTDVRKKRAYLAIESIFRQSTKPDKIILWLPNTISKVNLPVQLHRLQKRGLSVCYVEDKGPATKMIYTLKQFPENIIVTADDDGYYTKHWLRDLYSAHKKEPDIIHCYATKYMTTNEHGKINPVDKWMSMFDARQGPSHNLMLLSGPGCIFPANCFNDEVFSEEIFLKLCPKHDDLWWKAMAIRNNRLCKRIKSVSKLPVQVRKTQSTALKIYNVEQKGYDNQNLAVFDHFNIHSKIT
ncbi:glycosyltransferase [Candidatus Neomarinimicrobiota bacterium]